MRYIKILFLILLCSSVTAQQHPAQNQVAQSQNNDRAIEIAIKDFSKTKLYKMDSVFCIGLIDTFHRVAFDTISKNNYVARVGKAYPNIIVVDILGTNTKYFLDTTVDLNRQKAIPTRFIKQNGKIFLWWDKYFQLTDSTVRVLDKYHCIGRGGHGD